MTPKKGNTGNFGILGWFIGQPVLFKTDATFFSDGTQWAGNKSYFAPKNPTQRHLRAGWKRMVRRWFVLAALGLVVWGWLAARSVTVWAVVIAAGVLAGVAAAGAYRGIRARGHRRELVRPLHAGLAPVLGYDAATERPDARVWVARDRDGEGLLARVLLPVRAHAGPEDDSSGFRASGLRRNVEAIMREKLDLGQVEFRWSMTGSRPRVEAWALASVPKKAAAEEWATKMDSMPDHELILGVGRKNKPVTTSLDEETPHILLSMGSGAGKSVFGRGVAAQILHDGGRVVVLDPKRTSQRWLKDHPHVRYFRDAEEIHDELVAMGAEIIRRQRIIDEDITAYPGPRILVVVEELNMLSGKLRDHWAAVKPKGVSGPSPAITALNEIAYTGREPRIHALTIAQYATAQAMGGGASRENYGCRVLGRASRNAWRMLAPEITRIPRKSTHRGRFHVVVGDDAVEVQGLWWSDDFARQWAYSCFPGGLAGAPDAPSQSGFYQGREGGTVPVEPQTVETAEKAPESAPEHDFDAIWQVFEAAHRDTFDGVSDLDSTEEKAPVKVAEKPEPEAVSLKEAADLGIVAISDTPGKTLECLRAARKRDSEFPKPVQMRGSAQLYSPVALRAWARNRERA